MSDEFRLRPIGSRAALVEFEDLATTLDAFSALSDAVEAGRLDVDELVPATQTVLIKGGIASHPSLLHHQISEILSTASELTTHHGHDTEIVVPVCYNGEDLAAVAEIAGISIDQVVQRHTAAEYTVAFIGFTPGFAYMTGGDAALEVPRRASPRPRVPPGSVGLAGPFTGIYPREAPGGWQLIGSTDAVLFDIQREPAALLLPGHRVRFSATRERVVGTQEKSSQTASELAHKVQSSAVALKVIDAGLQTVIEDLGRAGLTSSGVGLSGTAIRVAQAQANRLVGNLDSAAALEISQGLFCVEAMKTVVLALTGAPRDAQINGPFGDRSVRLGTAFRLSPGERLTVGPPRKGLRTALALRGGIEAPKILGSRSFDTLAGIGPRPITVGDEIRAAQAENTSVAHPETYPYSLSGPNEDTVLRVSLGPRDDWFTEPSIAHFFAERWTVAPSSDRIGVRLTGDAITRTETRVGTELPTEGMVLGAIQVPPNGQPVIFLADHPTTGGYPVIGVVLDEDVELAAQLAPHTHVRFKLADTVVQQPKNQEETP